ncbi:AAA domain-containing protein 5 [Elsinoe fawcettii]|nr:AAA domain-containing protein 5 [Elsinoe fawcettii]
MNEPKKRPCRFFMAGRCNHGAKCKWSHDQGDIDKLPPFGRDLMDWQSKLHSQRSPAHAIGAFFRQAQALIESDVQVRQEVIASLATDKGCVKMEELCNIQWAKLQGQQFHDRFARDFLPLLNILTDHRVISSGVLEAHTGTIFNFIFGRGGLRGKAVFELVLRHLEDKDYPEMGDNKPLFSAVSLFSLVVQVNQNARITPGYQEMFNRFVAVAETLYHPDVSSNIGDVRRHLREAAAHLDHGKEFPFLHELPRSLKVAKDVAFRLDRAGPGTKGPSGARHDNDHEDIENIQIMPTYDEIASTTTEYLPLLDADSWHKEGMPGLLDRHFRLLREDTIGQLRDKVRTELERLQHNADGLGAVPAGHWSFDNATVDAPFFDDYRGLEVVVSFDQPKHLNKMTFNDRKTHWERSRRLSADSVVCILTSGGKAIFCHVTREFLDTRRRKKPDETEDPRPSRDSVSLVHRADRASVLVRPVEHDRHSVEDLLYLHACPERVGQCTLVEFSGVLLPAFMPTLQALQNFSKSSAIPFTELLVPVGAPLEQHIPPPAYADGPDFTFDLSTICHSNLSMSLKPGQASHTDVRKLSDLSSLDPSQSQTLVDALSRQLALLQGPPGTGKSFVGVHLLRVLVAAKSNAKLGPIICVCYTNHALDQLLEHLLDAGISQIVRIGSASKSERISNLKLKDLAKKDDRTKVEKHEAWRCRSDMEEKAKAINGLLGSLTTSGNLDSLRLHLQSTAPDHATQLFGNDESDGEWKQQKSKKNNPTKKLNNWLKGGRKSNTIMPDRPVNDLLHAQLVGMSHQERNRLYDHWSKALFDQSYAFIDAQRGAFVRGKERHSTVRDELDLRVLEQADVIGVTTSGLANKLTALRRLSSKILLCEEAGEVLEAHLLTALLPQIEHAILIGDHLQLRPHVQYHLSRESREGEKYSLDLSLFERLVGETGAGGSRLPYSTLHTQRRMHPEISNLIKSTLYPGLIDGAPAYEPVHGMQKRLFWFDHENREVPKTGPEGLHSSHSNDFEVEMVTALVSHLIKQGQRRPDEIAVLTPYLGQLRKLKISLSQLFELFVDDRDEEDLRRAGLADAPQSSLTHKTALDQAVRVATIDNFQGEEAAIVVISLVRSNEKRQCGFLKTSNRINVLLSRAQQGMYIIGDAATCAGIPMWKEVIGIMDVNQCIGYSLPIECPRHPEDPIEITKPDDFLRLSPDGGCPSLCGETCPSPELCQTCCNEDVKSTQVDLIMFCAYGEVDLDDKPCIFLQCGHIFTVESMDGLVELNKYYQLDADGQPAAFRDLPYALDIDQAKIVCPHCRTSLRNTARYGRPIRSALLIQSTLKFISWSNNGYVELMTGFLDLKAELSAMHEFTTIEVTDVELKGGNDAMIKNISTLPGSARYKRIYQFRKHLFKYARQVQNSEQPFRKVQDLVSFANRLKAAESKETFQYPASTVLQTKGSRMAACLILRCDLLVLMDFLSIHRNSPGSSRTTRTVDTTACRQRCEELITICAAGKHPTQEAESHLFLAQFAAVEVNFSHFPDGGNGRITTLRNTAQIHLDAARAIHAAHQGETKALAPDLEVTEKMLADQVFYTAVSDEEMRAVVKAMAAEFMSTGHWYRCVNGHAFTVGECGMPMEMARCSECGAAVGGMHHAATEGVMRANDLVAMERGLERMRLNA